MWFLRQVLYCTLWLLASTVATYDCPFPTCEECLPDAVRQAPGIGVELTDTYAAISVHYYNGSISNLSLVPGSPEYTALLTRLSLLPASPESTWWSNRLRKLNRLLGRPSTSDVSVLAGLLTDIHDVLTSSLPTPLPKIAISFHPLPGLVWQDVHEGLSLAGLEHWTSLSLPYPRFIPSPNAALAARGAAVCTEWRNLYTCIDEHLDGDLPLESLLSVSLTNGSLSTAISRVDDAFSDTLAPLTVHSAAPHLGAAHLPIGDDDDTKTRRIEYWSSVRDHIAVLPRAVAERSRPITALVLQGSEGALPELREAIKEALGPSSLAMVEQVKDVPPPIWAAARGAALYARRRQEAPADCQERESCYAPAQNASQSITDPMGMAEQTLWNIRDWILPRFVVPR